MSRVSERHLGTTRGHEAQGPRDVTAVVLEVGDLSAEVWSYGARLVSVGVPDRSGLTTNVAGPVGSLAGYDDPKGRGGYRGATIGRYANRIAGGRFSLDGHAFQLTRNDGPNHLHGGWLGFDQVVWEAEAATDGNEAVVTFSHFSPDGDEGYPGNLDVRVRYALSMDSLTIDYEATTDAPTIVNLTNHAYWNLSGGGLIGDHVLQVLAKSYLPVDEKSIPTGTIEPVSGTRFDFVEQRLIGDLSIDGGIDHCFVLDQPAGGPVAVLQDLRSGRAMTVETDQPGLQIYTANYLDPPHTAVCLEAQRLPDMPNQSAFGSAVLLPGEIYRQRTRYAFDLC